AVPDLEVEKNPQPEVVVRPPVHVLVEQALHLRLLEEAASREPRLADGGAEQIPQLRSHPQGERESEALLAPVDEVFGKMARGDFPKDVLETPPSQLEIPRDACR